MRQDTEGHNNIIKPSKIYYSVRLTVSRDIYIYIKYNDRLISAVAATSLDVLALRTPIPPEVGSGSGGELPKNR